MRESLFVNENEMVSFYLVDVEIGRGPGTFFTPWIENGPLPIGIQTAIAAVHMFAVDRFSISIAAP
jgi:hypothetical protein